MSWRNIGPCIFITEICIEASSKMTQLDRFRAMIQKTISENGDTGTVSRTPKVDNGYGGLKDGGEPATHTLYCRVQQGSSGIWPFSLNSGNDQSILKSQQPQVIAAFDADLQTGDTLTWRGENYTVGDVNRPSRFGGPTHTQAALTLIGGDNG
jgi:hypothetical protein